jgi:hypothetical protein
MEVFNVNAAFVMLTSAWLAGADPAPPAASAPAAPAAPAVVSSGNTCGGCGSTCGDACCDPCAGGRKKIFANLVSRVKSKFHRDDCCEPACAPAKPACCEPAPAACNTCADPCCDTGRKKPLANLASRVRSKFHRHDCCGGVDACGCGTSAPAPAQPAPTAPQSEPKKMPTTIGGGTIKIQEGAHNPFESSRRYDRKFFASHDYSQLTGQLFFVHIDGGRWVLRYAPISTEDPFGGSMILSRDSNISGYKEGDVITVEGEILAEKTDLRLGGAHYRVHRSRLVERRQGTTAE